VIDFSNGSTPSDNNTLAHALSDQWTVEMRVDRTGTSAITAQNLIAGSFSLASRLV
jgi:hypothetical protein